MSWLLFLLVALVQLGCSNEPTFGRVYGSLVIPDCDEEDAQNLSCAEQTARTECDAFDLNVKFFALQFYPDNSAKIRFQAGGSDFALTDGLIFDIRDTRLLRGRLGQPLTVGNDENIRAGLGLFDLCPDSTQSYDIRGSLTFDEFGVRPGDRVSGTLNGLEVRDGRDERTGAILGFLQGNFQFSVETGPPYQRFQR